MNKKKVFGNVALIIVVIVLVLLCVWLYSNIQAKKNAEEANNVTLTDILYDSDVEQIGYFDANAIIDNFISAYNNSDGESLVASMDLIGGYIYNEYGEEEFDSKYEEILSNPSEYEDLIIMEYSVANYEDTLIAGVEEDSQNITFELIENTEIEDTSKYISKMTAKIRTVSESEEIDQVDELEFILLHRDGAYYIMYYEVASDDTEEEVIVQ